MSRDKKKVVVWKDEFGTHRAKIVEFRGELGMEVRWTDSCSGCYEMGQDAPYDKAARCYLGMGCEECGYRGKRRRVEWAPLPQEALDALRVRKASEVRP